MICKYCVVGGGEVIDFFPSAKSIEVAKLKERLSGLQRELRGYTNG